MSVLDTLEICFSANLGGVDRQLRGLADQLGNLSASALKSENSLKGVGARLTASLAGGIRSGASQVSEAASDAAKRANFRGGEGGARSAGRALSAGFASGIRSGKSEVNAAVSSIVNAAVKKIRTLLSIHSPSKVTQGFGEFFGEGFAEGIRGSAGRVAASADALSRAAVTGLNLPEMPLSDAVRGGQSAQNPAPTEELHITVPLEVDGIKLGEASIRGINAVTRSAGRVLLDL